MTNKIRIVTEHYLQDILQDNINSYIDKLYHLLVLKCI